MGTTTDPRFQLGQNGLVNVALPVDEYEVFKDLTAMVHSSLIYTDPTQPLAPAVDRLFPAIFEDPLDALAYEKHNTEFIALRHLKLNRFARVLDALSDHQNLVGQMWRTQLTLEELDVWMLVFQDIRLSLSQIANVRTEDDMERLDDEWGPLMNWLAYMLEEIIHIFLKSD